MDNINNGYAKYYNYTECTPLNLRKWIEKVYNKRNDDDYVVANFKALYKNNRN